MDKNRIILGTRKGLIILQKNGRSWEIAHETFPGVPISYAMEDDRSGVMWVCADNGHWGQKLYRSQDGGQTLDEVTATRLP